MNVQDLMTKEPVACDVGDSVEHAAQLMRDKNVGCLVVLKDDGVVGMVTDRDICIALADGKTDGPVRKVMKRSVAKVEPDDSIFHAISTFRSGGPVRRLPVVTPDNRLVGLLSVSDLAVVTAALNKAIFLEETHHADEPHLLTGGKETVKRIRRPRRAERMPRRQIRPVKPATVGRTPKSGRGSA